MALFHRIVITGDIFRADDAGGGNQNTNIVWLYNLLSPALNTLTDLPTLCIKYSDDSDFVANRIYSNRGMKNSLDNWLSLYDSDPSHFDLDILHEALSGALVICFEMPEFMRKALTILNIPYIDFVIHPARFMDDLLFGIRSNHADLGSALSEWIVTDQEINFFAGLARAALSRLPRLNECVRYTEVAVFCGQVAIDRSLIRNGRIVTASMFLPEIVKIFTCYEHILLKPHPYATLENSLLSLTRILPNVSVTDSNFYYILSHDAVRAVYSLSSSTSIEARYFGKIGEHISPCQYYFSDNPSSRGAYLTIGPEIYLPQFWKRILNFFDVECRNKYKINCIKHPNRVRRSLGQLWDADIFLT